MGLYLIVIANSLGMQTLLTLIPEYARMLESSPFWIGMFTTSFAVAGTVVVLPLGWISDRVGKTRVLRYGIVISVVAYVMFLFVQSEEWFILARIVQGLGATTVMMSGLALVGELAGAG
ncbi:MAG: MFS transporter, partial [Thermaerobacterales bacterium]